MIKPEVNRHFSIYTGLGRVLYFDNMEFQKYLSDDVYIDKDSWGCSLKFMWDPEHRLSLGLETGYYQLYSFYYLTFDAENFAATYRNLEVSANYIPIFLNVNMKIINNFSLGIGTEVVILRNTTDAITDIFTHDDNRNMDLNILSSTLSIANYYIHASYIFPFGKKKKWQLGAEARYLWIGKTNDHDLTYQLLFGYRF